MNAGRHRKPGDLLPQERLFALEYLSNGGNATAAAIAAGYSVRTAHAAGNRLLKRPVVAAFIAERGAAAADALARKHEGLELSASRVLEETMRLAYSDVRDFLGSDGGIKKPGEWPEHKAGAIAGYETTEHGVKFKLWDKPRALELLGKHLKLWTDVVEERSSKLTIEQKAHRAAELIAAALQRKLPASAVTVGGGA